MEKLHLNKRIVFLSTPSQTVRLEYCPVCQIETNHFQTAGGWTCRVCSIKTVDEPQPITEQRRESILLHVAQDPGLLTDDVIEELAELDGSDTSMSTQLFDAGFGPGGIY
jgi:hypothetical protein